ncbi:hypothetical protein K469DRAFT_683422 [Zopfia rhizophila CBS 207.26]|uniref:Uncharacterized protein n=1 Tax=Zopfia rhizophila CBS 207.26 TaxID=1314779 RepID=A0A6A6D9U3_9PEZI|nr:hypothetical protein K469DRAFT_683422 [Zopfia rhizophila CBS 207.26]
MQERLQARQEREIELLRRGSKREHTEAEEARDDLLYPQERERPLKALLAWIKREFPQIAAKYAPSGQDSQSNGDHQHQDQAVLPYSKPSPSGPARKASPPGLAGKSTRRKVKSARERSPLSQVQPSKVYKRRQRKRPLNQKRSTTRDGVWPPEGRANDVGQIEEQPNVALRRSERISQRIHDPAPQSPGLVRATKKTSQRCPDGVVRRSARILDRTEKIRSLGSDADVKPARSSTTAGQKSTRRTTVHTNTAYSGTPQGISKTRRWKATSKKGKNV